MNRPKSRSGLVRATRPPAPAARRPAAPVAVSAPVASRPAPAALGTLVKEGFAWGIGQSVAHTVMNRILVPALTSGPVETSQKIAIQNPEYEQCMKEFNDEAGCKHLWQG